MSIKKKEVRVCDCCDKEIEGHGLRTTAVANEGCSSIYTKDHAYDIGYEDFCGFDCFIKTLRNELYPALSR